VEANTIAQIPRLYSQFLRMYTSLNTGLSLVLVSQVRTAGIGGTGMPFDGMTGGNAIGHYCNLIVKMTRSESTAQWPYTVAALPPHSYVVLYKIDKIKGAGRYRGLKIKGYFYKGKFDKRFNIIAIAKDLEIHDGRTFTYPNPTNPEETITYTCRGLNEMINERRKRIKKLSCFAFDTPEEAIEFIQSTIDK
jgi:hypothetical protein